MDTETCENCGDGPDEREDTSRNATDLLPEYYHYRGEGCEYSKSCLNCPFPRCLYDEPRGRQRWLKGMRNREINRLFAGGWKVRELALKFSVSCRTIQRALRG